MKYTNLLGSVPKAVANLCILLVSEWRTGLYENLLFMLFGIGKQKMAYHYIYEGDIVLAQFRIINQ